MNTILTKITQGVNLNKERTPYIYAVALMGLFTFLFLGAEYLFVDVLSHIVSEDRTVLAQNYALGISAAGFALYPLFNRFCKDRLKAVCSVIIGFLSVLCLVFICSGTAYTAIFATGLVLFLLLGLVGSGVFYVSMRMMKTDKYLARSVGISYALGILLQFANNNLVRSDTVQAVVLSVFLLLLVLLLIKNERDFCKQDEAQADAPEKDEKGKEKILEMTIEELDLSVRSFNCLKRAGINTVEDLTTKTEEDMMKVRNLGKKSLDEVINKLHSFNLDLRSEDD